VKTNKEIEQLKAKATESYNAALEAIYIEQIKKVFAWFREKYPKRTLEWSSGMGVAFWVLDGEIVNWETMEMDIQGSWHRTKPDRKAQRLMPLWDFFHSIHDVTNIEIKTYTLDIGDVTFDNLNSL
jgi:hypothetical protein